MQTDKNSDQIVFDQDDLYREDTFTDRKVGSIKMMSPVKSDGSEDKERNVIFVGQSQMMTPMGAIPLNFEIPASNLKDALDNFPEAAEKSVEETVEELKKMQREQASSIVVPGQGQSPQMPGGGGGIQIP